MIKIQMGKTYNGMSWVEAAKYARQLQKMGMADEDINELLERNMDEVKECE